MLQWRLTFVKFSLIQTVDGRSVRELWWCCYLKAIYCFQFSTKLAAVLLVFVVTCVDICHVGQNLFKVSETS